MIVPVLDGEKHLRDQLRALAAQTYGGHWEVLVVDNGCRDRSVEIARALADVLPRLRIVDARARRGLNRARNAGVAAADGDFLAFCDADDVVAPGWLAALVRAGADADLVGGAIEVRSLNGPVRGWGDEAPLEQLAVKLDFLPAVPGGNCGMWLEVARFLGWDEAFCFGGSDIEFSWRAGLAGYRVRFAPDAVISRRHRLRVRDLARQQYLYGRAGPHLFRDFAGRGMPRSDHRAAVREWKWLGSHARDLLRSQRDCGRWIRMAAFRAGRLAGCIRFRVVFL